MDNPTRILTGLTEATLKEDQHLAEAGFKVAQHCYVCKRQEGQNSVCYDKADGEMITTTIELNILSRCIERSDGRFTFEYPLCFECAVLLNALG